jgi:hypothetical protein
MNYNINSDETKFHVLTFKLLRLVQIELTFEQKEAEKSSWDSINNRKLFSFIKKKKEPKY